MCQFATCFAKSGSHFLCDKFELHIDITNHHPYPSKLHIFTMTPQTVWSYSHQGSTIKVFYQCNTPLSAQTLLASMINK